MPSATGTTGTMTAASSRHEDCLPEPALLTDIRPGDYITAIDGKTFDTVKGMRDILDGHKPGDRIQVTYEHNGSRKTTDVLLASAPESDK